MCPNVPIVVQKKQKAEKMNENNKMNIYFKINE